MFSLKEAQRPAHTSFVIYAEPQRNKDQKWDNNRRS